MQVDFPALTVITYPACNNTDKGNKGVSACNTTKAANRGKVFSWGG